MTSPAASSRLQHELKYSNNLSRPISKRDIPPPPDLGVRRDGEVMVCLLLARSWVPITSTLTHMVYLLPFLSYLAGFKSVSTYPSDPDRITNTALEAITLSSSNDSLARRRQVNENNKRYTYCKHILLFEMNP